MSKKSHKALASATVMSLILTSTLTAVPVSAAASVERLEGAGREETAISVAKKAFADGAETVVLVNGYGYGDAVSATPLAKALNAPILLTNKVDVPSADLLNTLSSLKAKKVVIVGGEGVVTKALANKLAETYTVERIGGASRYETNAGVAKKVLELTGKKEAFLVNGQDGYADALSVASIAASKGAPVLFGNKNEVPSVVKNVAEGLTVSAVGGAGVLPTSVVDSVKGTRVAEGKDRFATNLEVLKKFKDDLKLDSIYMAFGGATPTQFADALVASAAAAKVGAPVVLSGSKNSDASTSAAKDYIKANHKDNTKIYLVGGTGSLDSAIESSIKDMVNPAVTEFKLESVKAENLHEVEVKFSRPVDKITATDKDNYTIKREGATIPEIDSVKLLDDGMTARLVFERGQKLDNQKEYKLSFNNIREADGTRVLKVEDHKFEPVDSTLPYVEKVEALGNRTIRVTFNEPVKPDTNTSCFTVDEKPVAGYLDMSKDDRAITIKLHSALSNGDHKINVKGVKDYSELGSIGKDITFAVVEDTVAPTITSIESATFEKVVIKFSEIVDPSTVLSSNIYWKQGTSKKYPKEVKEVSGDTWEIIFGENDKLLYATDLYVTGVKDYSGNEIDKDAKIQVIPTVDQSRPDVVNVEVKSDDRKTITVKFNKSLDLDSVKKSENYVIKNNDGKEVNKYKTATLNKDKEIKITLATELEAGKEYTIEISGVTDDTTLKNAMLPYNKKFVVEDKVEPNVLSVERSNDRTIVVNFDEKMATSGDGSILETKNYFYSEDTDLQNAKWKQLPDGTSMNVTADGKSAIITFPTEESGKKVKSIDVRLVKDLAGNSLDKLTQKFNVAAATSAKVEKVVAIEKNKVEVTFDGRIASNTVTRGDFTLKAGGSTLDVVNAELKSDDDKVIVLTIADAKKLKENAKYEGDKEVELSISQNPRTTSPNEKVIDNVIASGKEKVKDEIKATVDEIKSEADNQVSIIFNEDVNIADADKELAYTDIRLVNSKGTLLTKDDYTIDTTGKKLVITFKTNLRTDVMKISLTSPRFIKDIAGNTVEKYDETEIGVKTATIAETPAPEVPEVPEVPETTEEEGK
ncbi:cell wall-binding repeat-containing protein [uncultured Clostridium sp.]|uniref:cell wall-binding repeat-containing protein n=1 Tax=uncultured Clostridium sp. TaxID=59620 RepID=UPI0028EAC30B|nr:cell wall-binding repeat-containing protein [uncultured Clostridium sp.]